MEICCGQASLSRSLLDVSFTVLSVDHVLHDPKAPVTLLDLTDPHQQDILIDLLTSRPPDYIHLGMPCGTASRARERPVKTYQRSLGAPNPQPLRSADYPLGLPHINPESTAGIRLAKANILYRFAVRILCLAMKYNSVISLENPYRSGTIKSAINAILGFTCRDFLSQLLSWGPTPERHPMEIFSRSFCTAGSGMPK